LEFCGRSAQRAANSYLGWAASGGGAVDRLLVAAAPKDRRHLQHLAELVNLSADYAEGGDLDRAIAQLNEALRLDPSFAEAYTQRGVFYTMKNDYDRAMSDFTAAVRMDPSLADAYMNRGNIYNSQGDTDLARADYDTAIRLRPDYAPLYYSRDTLYEKQKDFDRARADFEYALMLDSGFSFARKSLKRLQQ
jgi:tetratricopeptide (TPR) repeat protein